MSKPVDINIAQEEGRYEERPGADEMASSHYFPDEPEEAHTNHNRSAE